jgi:hypothetical protein
MHFQTSSTKKNRRENTQKAKDGNEKNFCKADAENPVMLFELSLTPSHSSDQCWVCFARAVKKDMDIEVGKKKDRCHLTLRRRMSVL